MHTEHARVTGPVQPVRRRSLLFLFFVGGVYGGLCG